MDLPSIPAARAYIFDIDGTLLNSPDGVHFHAFRKGLREIYGIDSQLDNVPVHGNTDVGILRAVVEHAGKSHEFASKLPAAIKFICAEVERNRRRMQPTICPGIDLLARTLHGQGKLLGVASGNLESVAWMKLEAAGLRPYFSFGSFSGVIELREEIFREAIRQARALLPPHNGNQPERHEVCFIGDTPADILAARAVGAPIVAVATGIFSLDQLRRHSPDLCLSCCTELFTGDGVPIPER
jgi:phosphoglycolate phosphatase-like HAD superfamily hydrolase